MFPRIEAHVQAASGQARSPRARARDPRSLGARADLRPPPGAEPERSPLQLRRRPGDREQEARRAHGLGPDAQGRLPALQGHARPPPALPERLRLPGPLDRGRRRALARPQLEARDRGVRARGVRAPLPRGGRPVVRGHHARLDPARAMDGLGSRLLHLQRHEHRVRLADAEARARERLALHGPSLDGVVPALRHLALPARALAVRRLPGSRRSLALRPLPAARPSARVARDLDDDAVDAAGERRRGGQARRGVRAPGERRVGRRRALPRRGVRRAEARRGARRLALLGAVRRARPGSGGAPRDPVGRGHARPGDGRRPHRARLRRRGLRALEGARPRRADAR